jgi:hypothetical protein
MPADVPIACTLSGPEMRVREETVLKTFASHVCKVEERSDGYTVELATTDEAVAAAMALIQVERLCCQFLRFDLTVEAGAGPVRLALSGPPGTREFLATWLKPRAAQDGRTA